MSLSTFFPTKCRRGFKIRKNHLLEHYITNEMVSVGDTDISIHICPGQISNLGKVQRGGGGGVQTISTQNAKICPNLNGGGGVWSRPTQPKVPRSVQICIFGGGGGGSGGSDQHSWNTWVPPLKYFWTKFSTTPASYCITDSLSRTTYEETNNSIQLFLQLTSVSVSTLVGEPSARRN